MSAVLPAIGVFLALGVVLGLIRFVQVRCGWHPELARKCAHIAMGLLCLSFPWVFGSPWHVAAVAVLAVGVLYALRRASFLRGNLGQVLGSVQRESYGEIYFVISVALVSFLANDAGRPLFYVVPILVLTLADAVGALVGTGYGRFKYLTDEGSKSYEGSLAFFFVAFLAIHIPVLLGTDAGRAESLLVSLTLALLLTVMEAMAWRGLDNLFIPITTFVLLNMYLDLGITALVQRLLVMLGLCVLALAWRRKTTLTDSAALGGAVFAFIVWSLAGWKWLVAPVLLFLLYTQVGKLRGNKVSGRDMQAVIRVMAGPVAILFLSEILAWPALVYPFYAAFGCHLANVAVSREWTLEWKKTPLRYMARSILISWALFAVAYWGIIQPTWVGAGLVLLMLAPVAVSGFVFYRTIGHADPERGVSVTWLREGLLAPVTALVLLGPLLYLVKLPGS